MTVKAKVDCTTYIAADKKKIFVEGKEYYAYESDQIAQCYIVVDEYNTPNIYSQHRFATDFEIVVD